MASLSDVTVAPADSRADLRAFVQLPFDLYKDASHWVPPLRRDVFHALDPQKNAFFEHGNVLPFLARDGSGRVVGRIAGIYNGAHLEKYDDATGFFGFFETIDHPVVAERLFEAAETWLAQQHLTRVRGPVNPSMNDTAGLLVDGFDRAPSVLMPYNFAYYEGLLERFGYARAMTMWAYFAHAKYLRLDKMRRGVDLVTKRYPGLRVRPLDLARFDEEAATVLDIYNDAWSENWGHVPMRPAEFAQLARELRQIVDPSIVLFLEDDGVPVAFILALPNIHLVLKNVRSGRLFPDAALRLLAASKTGALHEVRVPLMGVRRPYHGRGLDAVMVLALIEEALVRGEYDSGEFSWILDVNAPMKNALVNLGAVVDKEYAMFEKTLAPR